MTKKTKTNCVGPDQTDSDEAVRFGYSLFAILTSILWIPALITNILFENRMRKVYEILEHLLYIVINTVFKLGPDSREKWLLPPGKLGRSDSDREKL